MIKSCSCKHESQDKLHGVGKRVMTFSNKNKNYRCTVCSKEHAGEPKTNG